MATSKLPLLLLLLLLAAAALLDAADSSGPDGDIAPPLDGDSGGDTALPLDGDSGGEVPPPVRDNSELESNLRLEVEDLRSKVAALESSISDRSRELKGKDDRITQLEKTVLEKMASIVSLQGEIESSQKKEAVDVEKIIGKVQNRANELEKVVEVTRKEIEIQNRIRDALEFRASDAEKRVQDFILKVENLEKKNKEQKRIIKKTERALKVAEEELMRTQLEATSKSKELVKVHGAWLPPWLASFIRHFQDVAVIHWNEHGKPAVNVFLQKASEKSAQVQQLAKPHLETVKAKWMPIAKEQWVTCTTHVGPYVDTLYTKTVEFCTTCKNNIKPHVIKVQEFAYPYVQKAKDSAKPHVDLIATFTKPHVDKVRAVLKPYTEHVAYAYGKFLQSATLYHHRAQAAIHERLEKHEITKFLATKEFVWFMASALLALPVLVLYRTFFVMFCKKSRQPTRNFNAKHTSRKPKRRYADK